MKNVLAKFASQVLSKAQMQAVKGGGDTYCVCYGEFRFFSWQNTPTIPSCTVLCGCPQGDPNCYQTAG